jgi:peptide/nickel transport system permease protein
MIPTLVAVSFVSFLMILLYERFSGSYIDQFRFNPTVTPETIERLEQSLGLDLPWYQRYGKWLLGILFYSDSIDPVTGERWQVWSLRPVTINLGFAQLSLPLPRWRPDFGESFQYQRSVTDLLAQYLPYTLLMTVPVFIFIWVVALPIGIYSATHQYSIGDHTLTFLGFLGLSIPNFFLALIIIYLLAGPLDVGQYCWDKADVGRYCLGVGGIFYQKYISVGGVWPWQWNWGKFLDYLWHLWPVVLVLGTSSLAGLIRVMRGQLLDILGSNYVQTARAKGLSERMVIYKHAVRNAINPMISIFGQSLQFLISGALVTAIVLNIPTVELLYYQSLLNKDEYLILTILTFFAVVLLVGNLIADILLALVDPRIRYD